MRGGVLSSAGYKPSVYTLKLNSSGLYLTRLTRIRSVLNCTEGCFVVKRSALQDLNL